MRPLHALVNVAAIGLAIAFAAPAQATVVMMPTLEEMTIASDVIVHVVVGDARVVKDGGRLITFTALEVKDAVKGAKAGDRLQVWQLGGDLDGRSSWIVGAHRFQKGEELVLFAMNHAVAGPGVVIPYGIGVGLFAVKADLTGPKVVELIGDVVAVQVGPDGRQQMVTPRVRTYDSVPAFKAMLQQLLDNAVSGSKVPTLPLKKKLGPQLPQRPAPVSTPSSTLKGE